MSGIYEIADYAIQLLHGQEDVTKVVIAIAVALKNRNFSMSEHYKFFEKIALEAFQYESETGSIRAIEWVLAILTKLDHVTMFDHFTVLVNVGFTMYNYVRDMNYRYGLTDDEQLRFLKQLDLYNLLQEKFFDKYRSQSRPEDRIHLLCLADVVYVAFVTCIQSRDEKHRFWAVTKSNKAIAQYKNEDCLMPSILMGLHLHHNAKLKQTYGCIVAAWNNFNKALGCLVHWEKCKASMETYFYDALYGKCCFVQLGFD